MMTVEEARKANVCRICGGPATGPFTLAFGREHAHTACLPAEKPQEVQEDRMLKWFAYRHLPETLQAVSWEFSRLATMICDSLDPGPERTVALRKLLEAKDAAVRAKLHPGG